VSKLGSVIGFSAEAGIWIAGAALIAGAAGMHWSVDLPKVDLAGLIPVKSASVASGSPGTAAITSPSVSAAASKSPSPSRAAATSPVEGLKAFFAADDLEFEAKAALKLTGMAAGTILYGTQTVTMDYKAGDGALSVRAEFGSHSQSADGVVLGDAAYTRENLGDWVKSGRNQNDIKTITMYFAGRTFTDKGVETKNKKPLHRIEVTDGIAFNADYARYNGVTDTHMALVYWVDDTGLPVMFNLSGNYSMTYQGLLESIQIEGDWTITKTSGVTITAPI
jgi:hypothetical protein